MAEFAILLPLLLLLTFGTIELGIFLTRQITLTGAAFLAARAATVGGRGGNHPSQAAQEVLEAYAQDAQQPWLTRLVDGSRGPLKVETDAKDRLIRVSLSGKGEGWSGLVLGGSAAFGNALRTTIGQLGTTIAINREMVKGPHGKSAVQARTDEQIDYAVDLGTLGTFNDTLSPYVDSISQALQKIPGLPPGAKSVVDAFTLEPLQAVARNPGRMAYVPGRTAAAVYASSDMENPQFQGPAFNQSDRLIDALDETSQGIETFHSVVVAASVAQPELMAGIHTLLTVGGFAALAESTLDGTNQALKDMEGLVFQADGSIK